MRIQHVIPGMAFASGPTQALVNLSKHQAALDHQVTIAYVTGRGADAHDLDIPGVDLIGFPACCLRHWAYSPALRRWLDTNLSRFDVVHIHSMWLYPNVAATRACWKQCVPYIVRPAGSLEPWCLKAKAWRKGLYFRLWEKRMLNRAAAVHAVSEQEAQNVRALGITAPVITIPNGIDLAEYQNLPSPEDARRRLGLPQGLPLALFLSRIHPKKGLDILGQVFCILRSRVPDARLVIVGPDRHEYAAEIKALYQGLGIADDVVFLGEKRGLDKVAAYAAADVFILPTHSENFGIVVAESLIAGTPVIVSQNTPWKVVEDVGAGFWLELDAEVFAERAASLLADPDRARSMGRNGQKLVSEHYDWSAIADELCQFYGRIITQPPADPSGP